MRALRGGFDDIGRTLALLEGLCDLHFPLALGERGRPLAADPATRQRQLTLRFGRRLAVIGHDYLRHQYAARGRHECGGQEKGQIGIAEQPGISGKDRAGNAGHAHRHEREQPRGRKCSEVRAHDKRAFGLADKNIRRGP